MESLSSSPKGKTGSRPAHHAPNGKGFVNPWPSFHRHSHLDLIKCFWEFDTTRTKITDDTKLPKILPLDRSLIDSLSTPAEQGTQWEKVAATWLGHACFLVQVNGVNILYDPVFSSRCSPVQFMGPKRYTPPPCKLDDLPRIDIVIISHNHYDHLDLTTVQKLYKEHRPYFFVPLGNKAWFNSVGIKDDKVIECDWWDEHDVDIHAGVSTIKVICTPCQHFTGRSIHDHYRTLWASWAIQTVPKSNSSTKPIKVFFGGDTGYRYVPKGSDENNVPTCPVFKEIGERVGPFDLSMLPIGAYSPRWFMSPIHCSPEDAVRLHEDVLSKQSIGMHWGTWILTDEDVTEPPKRLEAEMKNRGHDPSAFNTIQIGETFVVDVN
ncbi:hypothetical protein BGW41_004546 [Actinomortierella wolfii]|nr:hypothetical protein BGW41_004546 [Actinomortierella wolfii]